MIDARAADAPILTGSTDDDVTAFEAPYRTHARRIYTAAVPGHISHAVSSPARHARSVTTLLVS